MDGEVLLSVESLTVRYGDGAPPVRDVSFEIRRSETLAFVGESGCGKTTLAMAPFSLLPSPPARIAARSVKFLGREISSLKAEELRALRGDRVGVIFQDPMTALSPLHRAGRQIEEAISLHRDVGAKERKRLALEWLGRVGLGDCERIYRSYPHELSGGMQQRVMIAMALVNNPSLVIADEPTTALDATTQMQVLGLVRDLVGRDSALMLITHDMGVVEKMATRVAVMYLGRIVELAPAAELFRSPLHPYTAALLKARPGIGTRGRPLPVIEGSVPSLKELRLAEGCAFRPRCPHRGQCRGEDVLKEASKGHFARCAMCV